MNKVLSIITATSILLAFQSDAGAQDNMPDMEISINYVVSAAPIPPRAGDTYTISFKNGRIKTYLPFIGTSDYPGYGACYDPSIELDCKVENLSVSEKKNGEKVYRFTCIDTNNLVWEVSLSVFEGETADVRFMNSSRSIMNYRGEAVNQR